MTEVRVLSETHSIRFQDHLQDLVNNGWTVRKIVINDLIDSFHDTYYHAILSKDIEQPQQQNFEWDE